MEVTIEITEGCTDYSYRINGVEWNKLYDKESKHYNIELLDKVVEALIDEAKKQYHLPDWILEFLFDGVYTNCSLDMFAMLVSNNKRAKLEDLYHCDECGDDVYRTTLKINVDYGDNHEHTRE